MIIIQIRTNAKRHLPSIVYALTALVSLAISFIDSSDALDIAYHNTYFVIAKTHIWLALTAVFFLFAGISFTLERIGKAIKRPLFLIHLGTTVLGFIFLYYAFQPEPVPVRHTDFSVWKDFKPVEKTSYQFPVGYVIFRFIIGSQVIFVTAVLLAIFKSKQKEEL